ncbi:lipocalin-like domain-containing protein [Streptomyces sp. URMC 123]|uniref:lipocalin-like domain-containing protein n=1 Tax=Streptomyces sp. URMC 123 TaxID=3423403 RepID=UPI003F19866B
MRADELVGVWHLVSYHDLDNEGTRHEGPLGPAPRGLLVYTADGHVTVNMMRTSASTSTHTGADTNPGVGTGPGTGAATAPGAPSTPDAPTYMGYAGRWHHAGDKVIHRVEVTPKSEWVDTEQVRDIVLAGDVLTLYGTAIVDGRPQRRVLQWQRAMGRG